MSLVALFTCEHVSSLSVFIQSSHWLWPGRDARMISVYFEDNSGLLRFGSHFCSFGPRLYHPATVAVYSPAAETAMTK